MTADMLKRPLRQGETMRHHVHTADGFVIQCQTPELATALVDAVNGEGRAVEIARGVKLESVKGVKEAALFRLGWTAAQDAIVTALSGKTQPDSPPRAALGDSHE